jgi:hypothetical protein
MVRQARPLSQLEGQYPNFFHVKSSEGGPLTGALPQGVISMIQAGLIFD